MWKRYKLEMRFTRRLMAGVPKHPDLIKSWLEARAPSEAAFAAMENPTPLAELAEEVINQVGADATEINKIWCGFKSDDNGLYVDGYHIKSHLKDCANRLQLFIGIKALKAKLADKVAVEEEVCYLGRSEPDGYWEHPIHLKVTPQGPRSALKRNDYVERPTIAMHLMVLDDGVITTKLLEQILTYGSTMGFGAERGLGNGRYSYTLTELPDKPDG